MTRDEVKTKIILKLNEVERSQWGYGANKIQDVAEQVLSKKDFKDYLIQSNKDMNACDGQDGILFNGRYFDWKLFDSHGPIILGAFLDYFSDKNLERIYLAL